MKAPLWSRLRVEGDWHALVAIDKPDIILTACGLWIKRDPVQDLMAVAATGKRCATCARLDLRRMEHAAGVGLG